MRIAREVQICRAFVVAALLETLRRREVFVLLVLSVFMVLGAYSFTFFGVHGLELFVKDMGFSSVGLFSSVLGVAVAARQLPEEIQRRTIYPLLARPITRWQLLLGKFAAAWVTCAVSFTALSLVVVLLLTLLRIPPGWIFLQFLYSRYLGFMWLCGFVIFLSTVLSSSGAFTIGLLLTLGSGVFTRLLMFIDGTSGTMKILLTPFCAFLPQYSLFDLTKKLVYGWEPVHPVAILGLTLYGVAISLFWLRMAWLRLRYQAV
ncbi:MAG: ABC transporter permease [Acidobacteria bacterium]|nr:ABC transporter permease [Acidobacteriota bacterium]